jgi:hypothetical protein
MSIGGRSLRASIRSLGRLMTLSRQQSVFETRYAGSYYYYEVEECWCRGVSRLKRGLSACGQLEVVSDLCQKQRLRRRAHARTAVRIFIFSPPRAHIIYKPSRRESARACSRSSERRRDLPQSGCYQTDNTHTHQLSFWPPAGLTEKRSQLSARCCCLLCTAIYAFFSL